MNIWFCSCEPEAVTLVRYNMWPATPVSPKLAFHQDLLLWLEALLLEACIGTDAHHSNSLKKAFKCNRMPADAYEDSLYRLPQTLLWETVSNVEELTSVEINCMFTMANRAYNMITRAESMLKSGL